MKLAIVQFRPVVGDVEGNIQSHITLIQNAAKLGAEFVLFPELSLTGYEPGLATSLSLEVGDSKLHSIQNVCNEMNAVAVAGVPLKTDSLPEITAFIFQPNQKIELYSKQFLHEDELPFFRPGKNHEFTILSNPKIALAICYELSIKEHSQNAFSAGAEIYLASVAKTGEGMVTASEHLKDIANRNSAFVLCSNSVGLQDGVVCGGGSAIWGPTGQLLAKLNFEEEGLLVLDTKTSETLTHLSL